MTRIAFVAAVVLLAGAGVSAYAQVRAQSAAPAARGAYDPFAMVRASQGKPGDADYDKLRRRQEVTKKAKDRVRPPHHPGNRSPHQPGEPFHDKDGDGVEDHGGHGPNNNPGNPPPFTPPGGGTGTNPGGQPPGNGNGNGNSDKDKDKDKKVAARVATTRR